MREQFVFLLLILSSNILSAQELKALPDCKDMKEKIITIQNSFDRFLRSFKNKETGKDGDKTIYSSDFEFCGQKAVVTEGAYETVLSFEFESKNYDANVYACSNLNNKIITSLKEVFSKWYFEEKRNEDEESKATTNYFFETGKSFSETKNYIKVFRFIYEDERSFSLEFVHGK